MIIFDLDGTLADCEHRRHLVDPLKNPGIIQWTDTSTGKNYYGYGYENGKFVHWKPDWDAFYDACDKDTPIEPVIEMMDGIYYNSRDRDFFLSNIQIWSGRSESVRNKTLQWLDEWILFDHIGREVNLKMRPIGDSAPDDALKEQWLDEALAQGKTIKYVFDDRPKVVRMWRRRGIFVFNCNQHDGEF